MKQGSAVEALKRRLDTDLAEIERELEAERLRSLSEEELDQLLAEEGFDFAGYKEKFDATLRPFISKQSKDGAFPEP